jgi:DMSO/TMAO reductase YedYZ molybdopterin-dependent catalytic subunit
MSKPSASDAANWSEADIERAERYAALDAESPVLSHGQYRSQSRRSFLTGGAMAVAGFAGWQWLRGRPEDNRAIDVLRRGHEFNESLWRKISREQAQAPTFDRSESSMMRVNGRHGIGEEIDLDAWELTVLGPDGSTLGTHTMDDILALPKVEMTIEHKCVEGWSHIVTWGGTRFSDFMALYADELGEDTTEFVSMETPDGDYFVGLDMPSMRNSQMLLAYELQGEPLTQEHGAPLRLATPNKYGIKTIKRIGTIEFTNEQPTDFWFERGYDWYAQL